MPDQLLIEDLPTQAESFALQMSKNDQRFTAVAVDASGRIFVAWHDPQLRIVICEDVADRLVYRAGPLPTSDKCSCVALAIVRDGEITAYYGARTDGTSGPFPLMRETCRIADLKAPKPGGDTSALAAQVAALATGLASLQEQCRKAGLALSGA